MKHQFYTIRNRPLLIPRHLQPGDLVGVVAASGPPIPESTMMGLNFLQRKGLRVVTGKHLYERHHYLAGSDAQRIYDLNAMLTNPEVRAVLFARGGYGAMRILTSVDCEAVFKDPKILLGMSDVTVLQMSLHSRCGLATLSGPMVSVQIGQGLDRVSEESLVRALTETLDGRDLFQTVAPDLRILRKGKACGLLLGGCLSLVTALLGTPHFPDCSDSVLFLEDVHEPAYRIDRMATQLKLAGVLEHINGLILGHFIGPDDMCLSADTERIFMELTSDNPVPVISGFPHGHKLPNLTIPHGVPVELDTAVPSLIVRTSGGMPG